MSFFGRVGHKISSGVGRLGHKVYHSVDNWNKQHHKQIAHIAHTVGDVAGKVGKVAGVVSKVAGGALPFTAEIPILGEVVGGVAGLSKGISLGAKGIKYGSKGVELLEK